MRRRTGKKNEKTHLGQLISLAILVFGLTNFGSAATLEDLGLESWSGTGAREAALVIDFWPGNALDDTFAFGVRFDDTITGLELLSIVQTDTSNAFRFQSTDWGWGSSIDELWYTDPDTAIEYHAVFDWPDAWISYWLSDNAGETWTESMVGAAGRILGDGDTDGWLAKPGADDFSQPVAKTTVPEPSTVIMIAGGALCLLLWWRRPRFA